MNYNKMRILFVTPAFYPATPSGGLVSNTYELTKRLAKKGCQVTVYSSNAYDFKSNMNLKKKISGNLTVCYFKNWSRILGFFFTPGMIVELIKNCMQFDVIHIHSARQFQDIISYIILSIFKKPYIITHHVPVLSVGKRKNLKRFFDAIFGNKILKTATFIVSLSSKEKNEYQEIGIKAQKIKEIPFGVNIPTSTANGFLKSKLNLNKDDKIILFLGRLEKKERIGNLIQALQRLNYPNLHLVFAGPDYGNLAQLKKIALKCNLTSRVHFIGFVNHIEKVKVLHDASMLISLIHYGPYSTSALEGAAVRLPVILLKSAGLSDEFSQVNAALIMETYSIDNIAKAIRWVIDNPGKVKQMSQRATELLKKFDWNDVTNLHLKMYEEFLNKN